MQTYFHRCGSSVNINQRTSGTVWLAERSATMTDEKVYDESSEVTVEDGIVNVAGPDAVDVKLTAEAAEEISNQLLEGAMKARGQRYFDHPEDRD